MVCSGPSRLMGGMTPEASQVRKKMLPGMAADSRDDAVLNVLHRVGGPGVLGDGVIVVVQDPGLRVHNDVLQD